MVGAEALLRWESPESGPVSPKEFIPVAEKSGQIVPLGAWVLEAACREIDAWKAEGYEPIPVAVNVSTVQFAREGFYDTVVSALRTHGVDPRLLELELTESLLLQDDEATALCLRDLRSIGLRVALDDFGTGYSALSYLNRIPLDTLKMDRCLVRDIDSNPGAVGVAAAVIAMAHSLDLRVVAEGVDCQEHVEILRGMGCDEVQGFIFGAPVPGGRFRAWLRSSGRDSDPRERHPGEVTPRSEAPLSLARYALVLDDRRDGLSAVADQLTRLGILVIHAQQPEEALRYAAQEGARIRVLVIPPQIPLGARPRSWTGSRRTWPRACPRSWPPARDRTTRPARPCGRPACAGPCGPRWTTTTSAS